MRLFIARHAETVFNADGRMQGHLAHTPLTRNGIAQAETMGRTLAGYLSAEPFTLWSSTAGRTLQTAAIIAGHLGLDYFEIRCDPRLLEIDVGEWQGRRYADIVAGDGEILDRERRLFNVRPPNGETYDDVRVRLASWLAEMDAVGTAIVVTHGHTSRVLRGLLAGGDLFRGVQIACLAPQGSITMVDQGQESLIALAGSA